MSFALQQQENQENYIKCIQNSSLETSCGLNSTTTFECVGENTSYFDYFCEYDNYSKENKYLCAGCNTNYTKEILVNFFYDNLQNFIVRSPSIDCGLTNITGNVSWTCSNSSDITENLWSKVHYDWSFLFVVVFIIAGGVGNILVCLAVLLDRRLQNVTNYFLLSLAIADLLVSLFVMPLGAIPGFLAGSIVPSAMRRLQYEEVYTSSDEDEDMPLARLIQPKQHSSTSTTVGIRSAMRRLQYEEVYTSSDEDEGVPLSRLVNKSEDFAKVIVEPLSDVVTLQPKRNDFVVVKFTSKKFVSHFVGVVQITDLDEYPNDFLIRYLKKQTRKKNIFIFPIKDDVSLVDKRDIVSVLPAPLVNEQEHYRFCTDLMLFENLG